MSNFSDVGDFHARFGLDNVNTNPMPRLLPPDLMDFRLAFLHEELEELEKGVAEQDLAQIADALVDLVYVAKGTAQLAGLPWQELWDDVHGANMTKVRAAKDGGDSKRGSSFDVVKPPGWKGPSTREILDRAGMEAF